ncbi:MAG: NUDIX domain-containing protein [Yoonia sp.]
MKIFVYGTLQSHALRAAVAGGAPVDAVTATLAGYAVMPVAGNVVPLIRAQAGTVTQGEVLSGITPDQKARLDAYEGAFGYDLIDVTVTTDAGAVDAKMYLPPDDLQAGQGAWSLDHWMHHFETMAVCAATELFSHDPALTPAQIVAQWPMIEKRGWAKAAALESHAPAKLRYMPKDGDVKILTSGAPSGGFFKLQAVEVQHRQFDGKYSAALQREVFMGVDAVMVLPYDPKRDRVLLVEQIRMGPALRRDANPWTLEPIAGMVDATETPEQSARRESIEEAGLTDLDLVHLTSYYPSPGASADYFYTYLGLCELPDGHPEFGGLDNEAEDLRLHVISFDQAMDLVASQEINAGPLIMMLSQLSMQRNALRKGA